MTISSGFITPNESLSEISIEALHEQLKLPIYSGFKAGFQRYRGKNFIFEQIIARQEHFKSGYEDQCSDKYYFDLFNCIKNSAGEVTRIVEVGVYMGGASWILAGLAHVMGIEFDLIDISESCLQFSYERIRRTFPEVSSRVRLWHGDLPSYVRDVLMQDEYSRIFLQHDGSHNFQQVVLDLGSLYYTKENIHSIAIQDTHLRGYPKYSNFVDLAVQAVFGREVKYDPIGTEYPISQLTDPNPYQGNYFMPNFPEGFFISLSKNQFHYPHPKIPFEAFFDVTK